MFFKRKEKTNVEFHLRSLKMNIENNYMDLAKSEYAETKELIEQYRREGKISEKDYRNYCAMLGKYSFVTGNYGHTDISKFLKERG